ncbi:MAG: metal ABC transporter permease [Leptospirales bacterium]|jgi:ABC-type Mn2+/Zn2+ transport system permease subunit
MIEYLMFYKYQLLVGGVLGAACAVLGVFVLLQRQTLFAATMSQAGVLAFALVLLGSEALIPETGTHASSAAGVTAATNWAVLLLNILLMLPFYFLRRRGVTNLDATLVAGIAVFSAAAQVLTVVGGLHTHLLTAYFGNILTVGVRDLVSTAAVVLPGAAGFCLIYRSLVSLSFDRDHARLSGIAVGRVDFLFFAILGATAALTIRLMGSFYTLGHLVVPALFALAWTRSLRAALPVAALYSVLATVGGFCVSLLPISIGGQTFNLPTSSVIVILLVIGCAPLLLRRS